MKQEDKQLRNAIFSLHTRRFGKVAEIMIQKLLSFDVGKNQFHDLYDSKKKLRVEVKFSRAQKKENIITDENVLKTLESVTQFDQRIFGSTEWQEYKFDCNIQQVKPTEFDLLYYGIYFSDCVKIFKMKPSDLENLSYSSDRQHKGNVGEGQFHLNNKSYQFHIDNFFDRTLTYGQLREIFTVETLEDEVLIVD